jgi:DNA (cytosine-5)-methyltransferase 1
MWRGIERHYRRFPTWGLAAKGEFFGVDVVRFSEGTDAPKLRDVLQREVPLQFDMTASTEDRLKLSERVNRHVGGVEILFNQKGGARMGYTVFGVDGVAPTLTSSTSRHYERYKIGETYRRLTNVEYARLQGFPDDHCRVASVYDQYELYGNAVAPQMAGWVVGKLMTKMSTLVLPKGEQLSMMLNG